MRSARDSEGCLGKRRPVYSQTDENSFSYHADRLRVGCDRTTMTVAVPSAERKRHRIDSRTIWGGLLESMAKGGYREQWTRAWQGSVGAQPVYLTGQGLGRHQFHWREPCAPTLAGSMTSGDSGCARACVQRREHSRLSTAGPPSSMGPRISSGTLGSCPIA